MSKFVINGNFLCRNLTGIERFAFEICNRLDGIVPKELFGIFIPHNAKTIPDYKNITIYKSDKDIKSFPKWNHFIYNKFLNHHKAIGIDFSNDCPLFNAGIVFIHDIYCKIYKNDFKSFRDKLVCKYSCFMYKYAAKHAKLLLTVSEFSKNQIANEYNIPLDKIFVIPNGWDHFKNVQEDDTIFKKYPKLNNDFYFTLGSLSKRKNLKWIVDYAEKHPQELFAISGKSLSGLIPNELEKLKNLSNIILLGYVSDGEVKSLMTKCKAFIFPSYYEGFGIPPLEALSVNAPIVISNVASLPEIYGDSAHYIDPNNADCNLEEILVERTSSSDAVLKKYTYDNAANMFYEIVKQRFCLH